MDEYCVERKNFIYRQKDQFSDSVGKEWIEALKKHAEECVTNQQMQKAEETFPFQTPTTKEAYYYREIFEKLFLCSGKHFVKYEPESVACSTGTAATWCSVKADPSASNMKELVHNPVANEIQVKQKWLTSRQPLTEKDIRKFLRK